MTTPENYKPAGAPQETSGLTPVAVTVRRILREWSCADDQPFSEDDVDRIVSVAVRRSLGRG